MLRRFSLIALGLGVAGLLCIAACAHRSTANAPPDPRLFTPSDPPQGRFGSVEPANEHLKPMTAAPKTAPEQETLKAMPPPPAPEQPTPAHAPPPAKTPAIRVDSSASTSEYTLVEELPEPIKKVPPVYPVLAREAGVAGVVMLEAHVREDGTVDSTRVARSIPMLDLAAKACVQQWRFKPAMSGGKPVAAWVRVPVRFMFPTDPR